EQEGMAVLVELAVFRVDLVVGPQTALVADDALALLDDLGGENALAVDLRAAGDDLLALRPVGLVLAGHRRLRLAVERAIVAVALPVRHRANPSFSARLGRARIKSVQ